MASRWEPPPGHTIRHIVSAYLTRIVKSLAGLPGEREEARPASIPEAVSTGVPFSAMRDSDRRVLSSAAMPTPIAVFGGYHDGGATRIQSDHGFSSMGGFGGGGFRGGGFGGGGFHGGGFHGGGGRR